MSRIEGTAGRVADPNDWARPETNGPLPIARNRGAVEGALGGHAVYHGGAVLTRADVTPVYLGDYWSTAKGTADRTHNDAALSDLVVNKGMTGIWKQYGAGPGSTSASLQVRGAIPKTLSQSAIEMLVKKQIASKDFDTSNPQRIFSLVLPPGCVLSMGGSSSRDGLGGFHGSVSVGGREVYYSAVVYSNATNGIDFTGNPQDNLSIAESHEITETVTDPNAEAAQRRKDKSMLGWYDDVTPWRAPGADYKQVGKGEIGDIPVLDSELSGDENLSTAWGRSDGFAFQKEWSNDDNRSELAPK